MREILTGHAFSDIQCTIGPNRAAQRAIQA